MPRGVVSEVIPASSSDVFDLVHDYDRRLEWDTLLSAAYLDDGFQRAEKGATSVCVGRRTLGSLPLKTKYVSFQRPKVAAVKMVNQPPFFEEWAASIRHEDVGDGNSRITYIYSFKSRPHWLRWFFEPIMRLVFKWETEKRLAALRAHFVARGHARPRTA